MVNAIILGEEGALRDIELSFSSNIRLVVLSPDYHLSMQLG